MTTTTIAAKKPNPIARSFRDLIAYQRARAGVNAVFETTRRFPKDERFELVSQMRRSARAAKAMIAAAWAERPTPLRQTPRATTTTAPTATPRLNMSSRVRESVTANRNTGRRAAK